VHRPDIAFELGPELGVGDIVDVPCEPVIVVYGKAATGRSEVRMVIGTVKQVGDTVVFGDYSEQSAHECHSSARSFIRNGFARQATRHAVLHFLHGNLPY
jgi:hypothetical protein